MCFLQLLLRCICTVVLLLRVIELVLALLLLDFVTLRRVCRCLHDSAGLEVMAACLLVSSVG